MQWAYELCNVLFFYWPLIALFSTSIVSILPAFQAGRTLPLNVWHPFDATRTPVYQLLYVGQVLVQIVMPLSFCASMAVPLTMALLLCAQYDVLCCDLRNLPWTARRLAAPGVAEVHRMREVQKTLTLNVSFGYSREYLDEIRMDDTTAFRKCPRKMFVMDCSNHN